ncbi:putative integral membrane protein [Truncatella angustata]|uniref:Integral membrane protein n=1 Tax=Truncatella angustata TaxID=152316 RepID=A0A9P8RML0_9PEZI|nr:putative integral membrane protein [Truncatella angustata]KAH6645896.1 putative integral membrane protein [Truncatella angustata]
MADTDAAAKEAAIKARVVAHMNKDHAGELELYLRAFNGLPASAAARPQITDMSLGALTIRSASGTHTVAIDPPLPNWGASRVKLVEMAQTALTKLGLSDIKIDRYAPPAGLDLVVFFGIGLYVVCAATLGFVRPGTAPWNLLDAFFPFGAEGYRWLVKAIFVPFVVIHVTESWWMASTRLEKHRVPKGGKVWWLWTISPSLEGVMAFKRFDRLVETERKKKDAAKH